MDPGSDNIRFFVLHGGKDQDPIKGELVVESPDEKFPYEALSYSCGSPGRLSIISIGEAGLPVRANLHAALVRLRLPSSPRYLWIDAICIDQFDNSEKADQIRRMTPTHTAASRVLIWLGELDHDSDLGMDLVRTRDFLTTSQGETEMRVALVGSSFGIHHLGPTEKESRAIFFLLRRQW